MKLREGEMTIWEAYHLEQSGQPVGAMVRLAPDREFPGFTEIHIRDFVFHNEKKAMDFIRLTIENEYVDLSRREGEGEAPAPYVRASFIYYLDAFGETGAMPMYTIEESNVLDLNKGKNVCAEELALHGIEVPPTPDYHSWAIRAGRISL